MNSTKQTDTILEVKQLAVHFPTRNSLFKKSLIRAVDGIDFKIEKGKTIGLVGESGCGKSTLGKAIVGLVEPTSGEIYLEEKQLINNKSRNTDIQMVFQDPYSSLNPRKRIIDLLREPIVVHKILSGEAINRRVYELLDLVGIPRAYAKRYPHEFSGGQRQRIGIARALTLNPKIIICDEPVSALDVSIQAQILNLLKDLQEKLGVSYLFIAHGLGSVKYISDQIAVMYLGKIVEFGNAEDIFASPKHPYTKVLLDAYPIPDPKQRAIKRIVVNDEVTVNDENNTEVSGCSFFNRCPFAQSDCKQQMPELVGGQHKVACHYPLNIEANTAINRLGSV